MITYTKLIDVQYIVKIDGKEVGRIRQEPDGFAYYPQNKKKYKGDTYPTLEACKASLEDV
jgi:hypothetical protein